jgi:NAD+ synthase
MKEKEIIHFISDWLKKYCIENKQKGFVIGISGGIDSALTSTLCAMTGLPLICIEMPIHQGKEQVNRAVNHISDLKQKFSNVTSLQIELTPVFESFKKSLPAHSSEELHSLALANSRARLRMTTLYYIAGMNSYLVAGTGNKIEDFGIGFYTKYGDGGVDISPIADLTKTQVYQLAKHLNIIESILIAPPTDGLFGDSRTDEDQIGASYVELEWAMEFGGDEKSLTNREKEVLKIYKNRNNANQHKMQPIPVCKISREYL